MEKNLDIIVFGATGFTGKCVVRQLSRLTTEKYVNISWGIAGRSKKKLQHLATEISNAGLFTGNIPIIESDVEDEASLKNMLRIARVVINCIATDVILSPKIVEVCIETKTHYVDVSSEILHILTLYRKYHKAAENADVLIIPSCGYSSIPGDIGMMYLERMFKGTLQSVECYIQNFGTTGNAKLNIGTWRTFVHVIETFKEYQALKVKLIQNPTVLEMEKNTRSFFFVENGQLWCPWCGVENDVVKMSQKYLHETCDKKPVQFSAYYTYEKWYQCLLVPVVFLYYYLCYFKFFAKLLINYPQLFSLGYISTKEPSLKMLQNMTFAFLLKGKGCDKNNLNWDPKKPTKTMSVKVSSRNPYDATAIACIMSAVTILRESSNMPKGVIMPGAAFYKTKIVDRLMDEGYKFDVTENE